MEAFLVREPWLLPCGGYGPIATETYGVTGSIFVAPVLEFEAVRRELKNFGGHELACFHALEGTFDAINILRFEFAPGCTIPAFFACPRVF
jgi:hypothetical protein